MKVTIITDEEWECIALCNELKENGIDTTQLEIEMNKIKTRTGFLELLTKYRDKKSGEQNNDRIYS